MKRLTLQQILDLVSGDLSFGELLDDASSELTLDSSIIGADIIRDVRENQITFADKIELANEVEKSGAAAVVVSRKHVEDFKKLVSKAIIAVDHPVVAFGMIVGQYRDLPKRKAAFISPHCFIDSTAKIADNVTIDDTATIAANVVVGEGAIIHCGVRLMTGVVVGSNTEIFPNAVIYPNTEIGNHCRIHANVVLGCDGFGYESTGTEHKLGAQMGNVVIEDHVDIGAGTTIDRGAYGSTRIGEGSKIDNQVQVGHNCKIGKRNLLCSLVGIAGSCTTGNDVVMAGQVGIGDHINIGDQVILGAQAGVMADISEKQVFVGSPATPAKQQLLIQATKNRLPEMRKKVIQLEKKLEQLSQEVANQASASDAANTSLNEADATSNIAKSDAA